MAETNTGVVAGLVIFVTIAVAVNATWFAFSLEATEYRIKIKS